MSSAYLVVYADDVAGKSHAGEPSRATLTGARRLSAGSDCACGYTAICALGYLLLLNSLRHERYHQGVE